MGIADICGNEMAKKYIKKELEKNKESGSYLFYGREGIDLFDFSLSFAKALNCKENEYDFCDKCNTCKSINEHIHSDLEIIDEVQGDIKISKIREVKKNIIKASYSGSKKVYIIKNAKNLRKESGNALLKILEELPINTFFIINSYTLNIMQTILSRCNIINFIPPSYKDLEISEEIFNFFEGNTRDILNIKDDSSYNFVEEGSYNEINTAILEYIEKENTISKAKIINSIISFVDEKKNISTLEKMVFAENIEKSLDGNRELLSWLLKMFLLKEKKINNLEKLLEIRKSIRYNVSVPLILHNFFVNF